MVKKIRYLKRLYSFTEEYTYILLKSSSKRVWISRTNLSSNTKVNFYEKLTRIGKIC